SDLDAAAELFGRLHSVSAHLGANHLIVEEAPLSMTVAECRKLLATFWESDRADREIGAYLRDVLHWAEEAKARERYLVDDPWPCVINTEVNSGNFICDPSSGILHLVDWEKALWGDPSQDLSHFCAPTTTLWKTDTQLSVSQKAAFIDSYKRAVPDAHLRSTIAERVALRDPFNRLRGVSWSAMAWVKYQTDEQPIQNPDTFRKIESYLDLGFLRGLFDDYLKQGAA
ncbi:phosphotransferase family protein, partial [Candidatus Bipolaricaulota bacterium]